MEARQIIEQSRRLNPEIKIIARAHSDAEVDYLTARGANRTMGEEEIARRTSNLALAVKLFRQCDAMTSHAGSKLRGYTLVGHCGL